MSSKQQKERRKEANKEASKEGNAGRFSFTSGISDSPRLGLFSGSSISILGAHQVAISPSPH